jgi:hypothetical protein
MVQRILEVLKAELESTVVKSNKNERGGMI